MSFIIKHADFIITMDGSNRIIKDGFIYVNDGKIEKIGKHGEDVPPSALDEIDGKGCAVFPGFINTHTHSFQSLIRGLGDDKVLKDWLQDVTLPAAANLTPKVAYAASLLTFSMSLSSGVTTVLDYAYALPEKGIAESIIRAARELGIRLILGRGIADTGEKFGIPPKLLENVDSSLKDIRRLKGKYEDDAIKIWASPLTMWSISKAGLRELAEFVNETHIPITVHLEETPFDVESTIKNLGKRSLEALLDLGLLKNRLLGVHCVYVNGSDIEIMKQFGVAVSHNPLSNMYLSSGVAPIIPMLRNGICVSLGLDGPASNNSQDMIETMKVTALLHKVINPGRPNIISALDVLKMATIEGAKALGLSDVIGSLEMGKSADLVLLDLKRLDTAPCHDPISTLIYSASQEDIKTVFVKGVKVHEDGKPILIEEEKIVKMAYEESATLIDRAGIKIER